MLNINRSSVRWLAVLGIIVSLFTAAASICRADALAYEGFNYKTNNTGNFLAGDTGGYGWSGAWQQVGAGGNLALGSLGFTNSQQVLGTIGQSAVVSGGNTAFRSLNTSASSPFGLRVDTNAIIGNDGTDLWISFLFTPLATNEAFAGVNFTLNGSPAFSLGFDGTTTQLADGVPLNLGQTYFIVEHVNFGAAGADSRNEYINPKPGLASPTHSDGLNTYSGDFGFNGVSFGAGTGSSPASLAVDEIRFGAKYQDVAPLPTIVLSNLTVSAGLVTFKFATQPAQDHIVQVISDLANGNWITYTNINGDGSVATVKVPVVPFAQKFFRVVSAPGNAGGPS